MPTASVEDYLKTIYHLQQRSDGGRVRTKRIAEQLSLAPSSVTSMLKSLAGDLMLDYIPYQGVELTDKGEKAALRIIRNHRLVELFLMTTLGFTWDEVHREAEALEHAISEELANRMDAFLGFPATDPHGDPIPRADGSVVREAGVPLSNAPLNVEVRIQRVLDQSPEILRYLADNNVRPGVFVAIRHQEPFDGAFTLAVEGNTVAISRGLAHRIVVSQSPV